MSLNMYTNEHDSYELTVSFALDVIILNIINFILASPPTTCRIVCIRKKPFVSSGPCPYHASTLVTALKHSV